MRSATRAALARRAVRLIGRLVPRWRRTEWLEEWTGELETLLRLEAAGGLEGYPSPLAFVAGAVPHAVWMRKEEWTMDSVVRDVAFAARVLRRSPGFTLVAGVTLALGIGANASIFSLVNGLVLRPPAGIEEPDRLVQIARSYDDAPRWDNWSSPAVSLIARETPTLEAVAGYSTSAFVLGRGVETEQVAGQYVTGAYFDVLGVDPFVGRLLRPTDDLQPGAHPVVVLSHALWQRRFGGDRGILGRTIELGAASYQVVGIAPPGFHGPESVGAPPMLWVPAMQHPGYFGMMPFEEWGLSWLDAVGRLAEGVTFEEARAAMDVVTARLRGASDQNADIRVLLAAGVGLDPEGRAEARRVSALLLGIVGVVLLLACTNVANLFLTRAAGRATEVGVRTALGAGRGRLTRQLVTESLLLALFATVLAVPIVWGVARFLPLIVPYTLTASTEADGRVWAFLVGVGLASGLLFGSAPSWMAARGDVGAVLRSGGRHGGREASRLRDGLVVAQLALSLGLVTGAALLGRSVLNARAAEPGFVPAGLTVAFTDLEATGRYDDADARRAVAGRLVRALEAVPGVASATVANQAPIAGGHSRASAQPAGRDDVSVEAEYVIVGPRYFETVGAEILRGRALGDPVDETGMDVVVNEALAAQFWPGEDPVGRLLAGETPLRVVGVVRDVQMRSLRARANPAVYYSYGAAGGPNDLVRHALRGTIALHVRTAGPLPGLATRVREAVAAVDPELPVTRVTDMQDALAASMGETRTIGRLVAALAGLALALSAIGLYGVVSFGVSQRVREMGIRTALGASPSGLVRLFLARGLALTAAGAVAGLGVSLLVGHAFRGLLFGTPPADPLTLGGAALVLVAAAALAAWVPARRASRVDAAVSLREAGG